MSQFGEMFRMMLIFIVFQNAISYFFKGKPDEPIRQSNLNGTLSLNENQRSGSNYHNYLRQGDHFDIDTYINF